MQPNVESTPSPIDPVVTHLVQAARGADKGFVLGLVEKGGKVDITFEEKLAPRDLYLAPSDYRAHTIEQTASFIQYAQKYGTPERSLVFVSTEGAVLVVDESKESGSREVVTLTLPRSDDFKEWGAIFGKPTAHKELLKFLMEHEDNLMEPQILAVMQTVRVNSQVNYESEIKDDGKTLGIVFKAAAGEELKKFPKEFNIVVPILAADEGDAASWAEFRARVRLSVELPDRPDGKPLFTLFCPEWKTLHRRRITAEATEIREELDGWLVAEGRFNTRPHELKR